MGMSLGTAAAAGLQAPKGLLIATAIAAGVCLAVAIRSHSLEGGRPIARTSEIRGNIKAGHGIRAGDDIETGGTLEAGWGSRLEGAFGPAHLSAASMPHLGAPLINDPPVVYGRLSAAVQSPCRISGRM